MSIFDLFNKFFNSSAEIEKLKGMIENGAVLIDVRTRSEFNGGHAKNAKNIPLDEIEMKISKLDKTQSYILVCVSGVRSRSAISVFKKYGFENVYNGGGWSKFK